MNRSVRTSRRRVKKLIREEPVALTALVEAVIGVGIAFSWWDWSPPQTGAVVGLVAGTLTLVRGIVSPTAKQPRATRRGTATEPAPGTTGQVVAAG